MPTLPPAPAPATSHTPPCAAHPEAPANTLHAVSRREPQVPWIPSGSLSDLGHDPLRPFSRTPTTHQVAAAGAAVRDPCPVHNATAPARYHGDSLSLSTTATPTPSPPVPTPLHPPSRVDSTLHPAVTTTHPADAAHDTPSRCARECGGTQSRCRAAVSAKRGPTLAHASPESGTKSRRPIQENPTEAESSDRFPHRANQRVRPRIPASESTIVCAPGRVGSCNWCSQREVLFAMTSFMYPSMACELYNVYYYL
ncbi:hypothetical protein C8R43DRAFT_1134850 [Mycena crocata]|nr:hypothetical protein C8R43DRAFT_1134850 [Mycena crocata]